MIFSVWNPASREYDYLEDGHQSSASSAPAPQHLRPRPLGTGPAEASWPLPSSAQKVGSGEYPRGRIAAPRGAIPALGSIDLFAPSTLLVLGTAGALAWYWHKLGK